MNNDDMQELVQDFLVETNEIIEALDHDLVELETDQNNLDLLNKIFRGAHTMKGSSSFLGFDKLAQVTHYAEEILNKLRKGDMVVTREIMDVLLEFVDVTKQVVSDIEKGIDSTDVAYIITRLKDGSDGKLLSKGGAVVEAKSSSKPVPASQDNTQRAATPEQTVRVDVSRLDALLNLVGELVLSRNRLAQLSGELENKFENEYLIEQLMETTSQIGMNTTELQLAIMKTRMMPIGKVFNKFPRMVRDLSRDSGKEIDLIISGEDTEVDKSIIEEISDPLIHMVRNSCDHGVESPEIRVANGKDRRGEVHLSAYHEGNHIVIEIRDDGAGLDADKLKVKAVQKGVITADEASSMDKNQAYSLIFRPGFSTAEKITNVSGRGVGMDVVRTNIEKINGIISIESEVGGGSTFYLKLPLTLAIIQALLVEVTGETLAIPLVSVVETVRISMDEIHSFEGREVLKLRDRVLSLVRLEEVFELDETPKEELYVVVVAMAEKQVGFIVDNLIGQEEIVIKPLGDYLGTNPGVAGATITGDGRVRLIVDVAGIMEIAQTMRKRVRKKPSSHTMTKASEQKVETSSERSDSKRVRVLLCDDSVTDRKIGRKTLEKVGWIDFMEAPSGKEALAILNRERNIDLLISDIMMPDMDGFALANAVRDKGIDIPIIAMSARNDSADRKKLVAAGIDAFLPKPMSQPAMIEKIDELISQYHKKA